MPKKKSKKGKKKANRNCWTKIVKVCGRRRRLRYCPGKPGIVSNTPA